MTKKIIPENFDCIIVGGSYAGLSAAMALGRSLRNILVLDGGEPCNEQTPHSHNFLTQDGKTPGEILKLARQQVAYYNTVQFLNDSATEGRKIKEGFQITTATGKSFHGKRLIFATGIKDILPDIPGFAECWGKSVIHCPYCHGYEFRNRKTGLFANGERAFHLTSLIRNLTNDLTILTSGPADFTPEQWQKFDRNRIAIKEGEIVEIEHSSAATLQNVVFKSGEKLNFEVVYAVIPFKQHSAIPVDLGCELNEHGYIHTDDLKRTSVEGVYACGDNASSMRSLAQAVFSGNFTGATVNRDLSEAGF